MNKRGAGWLLIILLTLHSFAVSADVHPVRTNDPLMLETALESIAESPAIDADINGLQDSVTGLFTLASLNLSIQALTEELWDCDCPEDELSAATNLQSQQNNAQHQCSDCCHCSWTAVPFFPFMVAQRATSALLPYSTSFRTLSPSAFYRPPKHA